ncbi:MAG: AraC family transcriptional regulator, partial [Hungatella sp.]
LLHLCHQITNLEPVQLSEEDEIGPRLMQPEYSLSVQDVKTYLPFNQDRMFALCWNMGTSGIRRFYATIKPSAAPFCYSCSFIPGSRTQLHTHDYLELAYVVEGEFRQKILGKDIVFKKGELCLIDKNCLHQDYLTDDAAIILFIGIANEMFVEIIDENVTTQRIISFLQSTLLKQKSLQQYLHFRPRQDAVAAMESSLYSLLFELAAGDRASFYICKGLMIRIFRLLSTEYEFSLSRELRQTMTWVVFEEVTAYIRQHYAKITIRDLATTFHFQEDYFNRLIKLRTGLTYSEYVQHIRLSQAEFLLKTTNQSIEQIADRVGYHNKGYFYKIFKEKYHMTPSRYRTF